MEGAAKQDYSEAFSVSFGDENMGKLGCKFNRLYYLLVNSFAEFIQFIPKSTLANAKYREINKHNRKKLK